MSLVYLALGGNKGDVLLNLSFACTTISENVGKIIKKSSVYKTKAWGNSNQPDFYNQVICIETTQDPLHILQSILYIESTTGRVRGEEKWQPRELDIDILFYGNTIVNTPNLTIPHPYLHLRKFVLIPLFEIEKELIHPVLNTSVLSMLNTCSDDLEVVKMTGI